jgi:hypothetical protein
MDNPFHGSSNFKKASESDYSPLGWIGGGSALGFAGHGVQKQFSNFADYLKDIENRLNILKLETGKPLSLKATKNLFHDLTDTSEHIARLTEHIPKSLKRIPYFKEVIPGGPQRRAWMSLGLLDQLKPELAANIRSNPEVWNSLMGGDDGISKVWNAQEKIWKDDALGRKWSDLDVGNMLRTLGYKDFDELDNIRAKAPELSKLIGDLQAEHTPGFSKLVQVSRGIGRAGNIAKILGLGGATYGTLNLHQMGKEASATGGIEEDLNILAQLGVLPGGYLAGTGVRNHLRDLNNILVTYGELDSLGAGHKTPGETIAKLLRDKSKYNVVVAPTGQTAGRSVNPNFLKNYYAASVDTGWGLTDPNYDPSGWAYKRPTGIGSDRFYDKMELGEGWLHGRTMQGRELDKQIARKIKFHPDPPARTGYSLRHFLESTYGNKLSGDGFLKNLITPDRKDFMHLTYGDLGGIDPKAYPMIKSVGAAHPGVSPYTGGTMGQDAYKQLLVQETSVDPSVIQGKKIITVSGASRGDSVGARVRRIHDALEDAGELDKYHIVALGGKGKELQQRIATVGGKDLSNVSFVGFTKRFRDIANNADLHYMGMGGATPYEMMSHGGAPIITDANEQLFQTKPVPKNYKGSVGDFIRNELLKDKDKGRDLSDSRSMPHGYLRSKRGLHGYEKKLLNELIPNLDPVKDKLLLEQITEELKSPTGRHWMNPLDIVDQRVPEGQPGRTTRLFRGLDYVRSVLDDMGIRQVETPDIKERLIGTKADPLLKTIRDAAFGDYGRVSDKGLKWSEVADTINKQLKPSQEGLVDEIIRQADKGKRMWHLNNLMKRTLPGLGLLGLGGLAIKERQNQLNPPSLWERFKERFVKGASFGREDPGYVPELLTAMGAGATAGGVDTYRKAQRLENLFRKVYDVGQPSGWQHDPRDMLKALEEYGTRSNDLLNSRLFGVRNARIMEMINPGLNLVWHPKDYLKFVTAQKLNELKPGLGDKINLSNIGKKELNEFIDSYGHYHGFSTNPRETIVREIISGNLHNPSLRKTVMESKLADEYAEVFGRKGSLLERFDPVVKAYDKLSDKEDKKTARNAIYKLYDDLMGDTSKWSRGPLPYARLAKSLALPVIGAGGIVGLSGWRRLSDKYGISGEN